jgi:hypothetical protein
MSVEKVAPWVRVLILLIATIGIVLLSKKFTGSFIPVDQKHALIFQNALLLIVLGTALLEHHYTKPADSVVNSMMGGITLLSVYGIAPTVPWIIVFGYCFFVFVISITCVAVSSGTSVEGWKRKLANLTYRPAVVLGRSRILFTVVFISGLWFFFSVQEPITLALILFWGLFIAIWPLHIPQLITKLFSEAFRSDSKIGSIMRIDNPKIVRASLNQDHPWDPSTPLIAILPSGDSIWLKPLYREFQDGNILGTGILTGIEANTDCNIENSIVAPNKEGNSPTEDEVAASLGGGENARLIGFVVEGSSIGKIRFETLNPETCHDGMLVWTQLGNDQVYYQIVAGETLEESFSPDKHGYQAATATQLGTLDQSAGFSKYDWLPAMNAPIFTAPEGEAVDIPAVKDGDFVLGKIPHTQIDVGGDFSGAHNYHTALLGVTGSGKTELAFDMIRHALDDGVRVVCIDLTAQYERRLDDLKPVDLTIESGTADELSEKLFDVETGSYGAGDEKKALEAFASDLRGQVSESIQSYLGEDEGSNLGLIRLEEISNTKATLWITELYMTELLEYARSNRSDCPPILIVVEEAHTVMPEASTMGLGDFDSKGLVGKIAQIALQGRKYEVGLLVLAQRTATVSKTVLTQCNTIVSFTCYDDTSLGFLRNIFEPEHVKVIPNLPPLHAVAYGPWVRSQKPIVFEIPFDEEKAKYS